MFIVTIRQLSIPGNIETKFWWPKCSSWRRVVHGSDGPAGRVGSGHDIAGFGRIGSGQHFGFFSFLLIISWYLNRCESSNTTFGLIDIWYNNKLINNYNYSIENYTYWGRVGPRVGSGQTFCRQSRVGSGQRFGGSGRVGSKKSDPWTTLSWRQPAWIREETLESGNIFSSSWTFLERFKSMLKTHLIMSPCICLAAFTSLL